MRFKHLIATTLITGSLFLTGCSASNSNYTDANFNDLKTDVSETICSVSGKRVFEEKDIENFKSLANRLDKYEGTKKTEMSKLADTLRLTAESWSFALGTDLGEENAQKLTSLCEKVKN
jgi:hypothetical protein